MYKPLLFIFTVLATIICHSNALRLPSHSAQIPADSQLEVDVCPACVDIANQSINLLLKLIVDRHVLSSCSALCDALANETHSRILGSICTLACDAVGISEFVKILERADLDAIWYCELAQFCPINDGGDAKISNFSLSPASGPKGTNFTVSFSLVSTNGTGTGELVFDVRCPDRAPFGSAFLVEAKKPGTYEQEIPFAAVRDPKCDPTAEPCEEWIPGLYNITVQICNGECGSKHPHSAVYDTAKVSFQITPS